jgi:hypothetical protein
MSVDDFFASPAASVSRFAPGTTPAPVPVAAAPVSKQRSLLVPVLAGAVALLALLVALFVVLWPRSGSGGADPGMARLFGQQTRTQLPQPVTSDDCVAAVHAFPAIAKDVKARAAFVDGCLHP